ncbi:MULTISPECIES: serine/threonine-protein kinase [unclassified Nodularia (in: cyanobacteria)]|uniref:serine/threonine protein kinase n=1 Tax=unclassified Nodularia (in: cyanobacteria) TaxID=2656917 RepID=UPI00188089A5|nr:MULTISPECIES: serine/threonine-protein kinase [unclassified Nodularia (in: cyanobacteria)]MBE9198072.1 serine/threonine protein kinase [Nodularia sp. LEGE 06071]MCC2695461.1 serine/threonine protein kinase [Nodularia sp. LEGE 04288]
MVSEILGDRYEVQQLLGKKSGRRSLLAKDQVTGELVVVKLLSFNSDFEWDDLKLFEREAETLKSLSHPAIPRYLDYFEVNSSTIKGFALVQSYIPAQTLEQYLQTGRTFTEAEVKQVAIAVLEILIYLHGLHPPVIHRDLKPSNILLGERSGNSVGQVYLVDFGSVQTVLAAEGGTRTVVGTYGYMPPEQFGARTVPASDLYSLGATLIYLSTGTHPADLPQKDFRIQFEQVTHLSPGLRSWLQWMTEPSLERRSSSALEALKALDKSELNTPDTLNVVKPAGSKIQLTKNWDHLEILIPPVVCHPLMFFVMFFVGIGAISLILFSVSTIIQALLSAPFPDNLSFAFAMWTVPVCLIGFLSVSRILWSLFGNIRLSLDQQQISWRYELLGFKFDHPRPALRESITKLVYIPEHFEKQSDGNIVKKSAKLEIWAGVQKYQLGGGTPSILHDVLNMDNTELEGELEWLAHELSDWLGMEISQ